MPVEEEIFHNTKCEPEIVISYYCNLDICPYCYAREQKTDEVMSAESFGMLVRWFKEIVPSLEGVTVLGGEPTAIQNLEEYIHAVCESQTNVSFFSNGSFDEKMAQLLGWIDRVKKIYFHLEPLHFEMMPNHKPNFIRNIGDLVKAGKDVRLRVNFHGTNFDYEAPLNIALEYSIPLAWSITSPCNSMRDYVRREDMREVGIRLGDFFRRAKESHLVLELVRPIPRCAFPEDIFEEYKDYASLGRHCNVSSYVHPNMVVQFCSVMDNLRIGPIRSAEDLRKAILYFQEVDPKIRAEPSFDTCHTCDNHKQNICQGGCLSYKVYGDHT